MMIESDHLYLQTTREDRVRNKISWKEMGVTSLRTGNLEERDGIVTVNEGRRKDNQILCSLVTARKMNKWKTET
jgi:hypothetical protein